MHKRNIYKKPVDFSELAKEFPEFAAVSSIDITGKVKIDFQNPESLRVLTKCCLQKDFNLQVELPKEKLLPTIPLRLNYLLWIEDLLDHLGLSSNVTGVDIGCGASCIYCLLGVRMNSHWKMFALEIDQENLEFAKGNVIKNQLSDRITVIPQKDSQSIFDQLFTHDPLQKSFCICNPPFFSSSDEVTNPENRTGNRKRPRSSNRGTQSELVFEGGGEFGFVSKILSESLQLKEKIHIYSSMLGCKKNFLQLVDQLKIHKIHSYTTTEFVQGKTMRWGLAWSFSHDLRTFQELNEKASKKPSKPTHTLTYEIPSKDFEGTVEKLKSIFHELKIAIKVIEDNAQQSHRWELTATHNTWSKQRKKRRADLRHQEVIETPECSRNLHAGFEVFKKAETAQLQMFYISGNMDKDCINQILQFIKNRFKQ